MWYVYELVFQLALETLQYILSVRESRRKLRVSCANTNHMPAHIAHCFEKAFVFLPHANHDQSSRLPRDAPHHA
jgi:hypothetical protein